MLRGRRSSRRAGGLEALDPRRKWIAITVASALLAPAYWAMLVGLIAFGSSDSDVSSSAAAGALALGLAIVPFVFIALAFLSWHPSAPGAVVWSMVWFALAGVIVSALATDGVTGLVAAAGAGGISSLRADLLHERKHRIVAVAIAAAYAFLLARTVPAAIVVVGPAFPFTAIGMADHWSERQAARAAGSARSR